MGFAGPYSANMQLLTVGDGDLSFSLALARAVGGDSVTATSHEAEETVRQVFDDGDKNIEELRACGAKFLADVDATNLGCSFPTGQKFDRIVWNFPCVARGIDAGTDGQNQEMETNKALIREFCASAVQHLQPGGEVHITHKTKPPYNQWSLVEQVTTKSPLQFTGSIVFDKVCYPPYTNRKALDRKSFPVTDAEVYIFSLQPKSNKQSLQQQTIWYKHISTETRDNIICGQGELKKLTPAVIAQLRSRLKTAK